MAITASLTAFIGAACEAHAAVSAPNTAAPASVAFIVALPLRNEAELETLVASQSDRRSPLYRHFLTKAQFRAAYGPSPAQFASAQAALRQAGFSVDAQTSQAFRVHATPAIISRAFAVHFAASRMTPRNPRLTISQPVHLPAALAALGAQVIGLADLPRKHVFSQVVARPDNRTASSGAYWFTDLKQAYSYPSFSTGLTGTGKTIGIVIDSAVNVNDLATYFQHENFTAHSNGAPIPSVGLRLVLGGAPITSATDVYNPNGDGIEAALDMEQALGSAPGASALIYDIPTLGDDSLIAGYTDIVEDNYVDVVNSSFGGCELGYTAAYAGGTDLTGILKTFHAIFLQGNVQGITFVAAAGDQGGMECPAAQYFQSTSLPSNFVPSISFPADDPSVTAVGGTNLITTTPPNVSNPPLTSKYVGENAFADPLYPYDPYGFGVTVSGGVFGSGSGPSAIYKKPGYQTLVNTYNPMRTIPDVSMQMGGCPQAAILGGPQERCGFAFPIYDKQARSYAVAYYSGPYTSSSGYLGLIGTSSSAPEFAGLLAIKAQTLGGRLGNANGLIYELAAANGAFPSGFYRQGIAGYNGVTEQWTVTRGYNTILGVGTPIASNFLGVSGGPLAGDPQTPSNP